MNNNKFSVFFQGEARNHLLTLLQLALAEDGQDLTSQAVFNPTDCLQAKIVAKQELIVAGLPVIPLVMDLLATNISNLGYTWLSIAEEGEQVKAGTVVAKLQGNTCQILKAERVILNFISHLSGIATLVAMYVKALEGTQTQLLDTRKTLPGMRYPDKYAVLMGGGQNHRCNLEEILMLKDNHIDAAGSIRLAVEKLRTSYVPCPLIEVECRNLAEVKEAVSLKVQRIMLDNFDPKDIIMTLAHIPESIETEISGNISLENIKNYVHSSGPTYISVGKITHSAPAADFSMLLSVDSETFNA